MVLDQLSEFALRTDCVLTPYTAAIRLMVSPESTVWNP